MFMQNYRHSGVDTVTLESFPWWTELLSTYLTVYRPLIVHGDHRFVFVTRGGEPFTNSYFSETISKLLFQHTGQRVATNLLRSSFITHFYNSDASQDRTLCDSLASIMRHSVKEATRTYDRRTSTQRKRKGLDLLAGLVEAPEQPGPSPSQTVSRKRPSPGTDSSSTTTDSPLVVEFHHSPHQVIRERQDPSQVLLAKMQRSSMSNAPVYFVPANVVYEWFSKRDCTPMSGSWENEEFTLE